MKSLSVAALLGFASCAVVAQEEEKKSFTMDGEFGFILTTGNTETTSIALGINASQELEQWSNVYLLEGLYKEDSDVNADGEEFSRVTEQKFFASAQANYKLTNPDHRLFGFASYEDNRLGAFAYQGTIAAGWNQLVWEDKSSSFDYSVGPGYSFAETQEGESVNGAIIRGAANYVWNISDTAKFTQTFSTEYGSDNVKSRAETALTAQIAGDLSLKVSVKFDHNTDVAEGREKLDTETAATLVYNFF
ncbi:YdiY family protein [Glaciecola siphonariae]|uniref:YdiY family protein n=1 Tax=Glaciecola siphonariae TaxID=521012 RepID=A0ABV9LVM9_9ALTE